MAIGTGGDGVHVSTTVGAVARIDISGIEARNISGRGLRLLLIGQVETNIVGGTIENSSTAGVFLESGTTFNGLLQGLDVRGNQGGGIKYRILQPPQLDGGLFDEAVIAHTETDRDPATGLPSEDGLGGFMSMSSLGSSLLIEQCIIEYNGSDGISVEGSDVVVEDNLIFNNEGAGVRILSGTGVDARGNTFYGNTGLPIDSGPSGLNPNDPHDADDGPNNLQNHPEISSAVLDLDVLIVECLVPTATAYATYPLTVEFYVDRVGVGLVWIGQDTYLFSEAETLKSIAWTPTWAVEVGERLLATATDAAGNTSEFCAGVPIGTVGQQAAADAVLHEWNMRGQYDFLLESMS